VKAIIRANALALYSKRPSERIQAARVLGGLGEEGKPARRLLCGAMLDPVIDVRVAAADALKNIDPKMHYLAVVLATEKVATNLDSAHVVTLLGKIQRLEEDGEPLAPLVSYVVKFAASNGANTLLTTALTTLSRIGRKDRIACIRHARRPGSNYYWFDRVGNCAARRNDRGADDDCHYGTCDRADRIGDDDCANHGSRNCERFAERFGSSVGRDGGRTGADLRRGGVGNRSLWRT